MSPIQVDLQMEVFCLQLKLFYSDGLMKWCSINGASQNGGCTKVVTILYMTRASRLSNGGLLNGCSIHDVL